MQRTLQPVKGAAKALVSRIRSTKSRSLTLRNPKISKLGDKSSVFGLSSGKTLYGTFRANSTDVPRLKSVKSVDLTIGWNKNRNEVIQATLVTA